MHIVVVGAGMAGLGTALACARDGHRVTILERDATPMPESADAAFACCDAPATAGESYSLGGGERVPYREMVARVLAVLDPPPRLYEVPGLAFSAALLGARAMGKIGGFGDAAVVRMRSDLVFARAPAQRDFGYAPRPFHPPARMFDSAMLEE